MTRITVSDGTSWPRPSIESDEEYGVAHRLIYGGYTDSDLREAAQIIQAYGYLVVDATAKKRDLVARGIRAHLREKR